MELAEIRGKDSRQLALDLQALRKEQFNLKFRGAPEAVANTSRFRQIRRIVAQILTVLGERDRDAVAGEDTKSAKQEVVAAKSPARAKKASARSSEAPIKKASGKDKKPAKSAPGKKATAKKK
jgi:large subunit ribosomal protein L29